MGYFTPHNLSVHLSFLCDIDFLCIFQGGVDTATLDTRIKVANPDDPEPVINLYVETKQTLQCDWSLR